MTLPPSPSTPWPQVQVDEGEDEHTQREDSNNLGEGVNTEWNLGLPGQAGPVAGSTGGRGLQGGGDWGLHSLTESWQIKCSSL